MHHLANMDTATNENNTINWECVTEAVKIRKTAANSINRDGECHQLPVLYSNLLI